MFAAPTAKPKPAAKPTPGARSKVLPERITGKITDWKGRFGWIVADKPVSHADAAKHGGKIYLSQQDVEAEIEGIGSAVSFFVYADGTGLGAMGCRPVSDVDLQPQKTIDKLAPLSAKAPSPAAAGFGANAMWAPGAAKAGTPATPTSRTPYAGGQQLSGHVKEWKGSYGWIRAAEKLGHPAYRGQLYLSSSDLVDGSKNTIKAGDPVVFTLYTDSQGLGAENCRIDHDAAPALDLAGDGTAPLASAPAPAAAPAAGGGGGWGTPGLLRPALGATVPPTMRPHGGPRKRLTEVEATGEVLEWEVHSGWLRCHEVFEHEAAQKNDGKVFVSRMDVAGRATLPVGALVQFHVSADNNGLLAEAVKPF